MKVQCIERPPQTEHQSFPPIVQVGNVYTVISEGPVSRLKSGRWVPDWYELAEHPEVIYAKEIFIPVSDIDEREFVRDYNKETVWH